LLNLKQMLEAFLRHRREVVTRRTQFELKKARERGHVLEGLAVALANVDEIIALIKAAATPAEAIIDGRNPNLMLMPAHLDLVAAELELVDKPRREYMLQTALADVKNEYDYILIDCAPSLGLVTLNALTAADSVIIPIQCEYFALEGLGKLLNTVRSVQNLQNPELQIEGMLLTMYDSRLRLSNQVVDEVRQHFQQLVFDTVISRNVRLSEAPSFGEPIMVYDAASTGAENYLNLARELLARNAQVGA
jgi:chromosome partitioning protein